MAKVTKEGEVIQLHKIFTKIQNYRYKRERVKCLQREESFALKTVLQLAFDDKIKLDLPEGAPAYDKKEEAEGYDLNKAVALLGRCVKTSKLNHYEKEGIFFKLIQNIHKADAEIIIAAKDKKLGELYDKVTLEIAKQAFPQILS